MKILYDHQIFEHQKFGGISRYYFELLNCLQKNKIAEWELPIQYSNNEYLNQLDNPRYNVQPIPEYKNEYEDFVNRYNFIGKHKFYKLTKFFRPEQKTNNYSETNKNLVISKLKEGNFDVFHPTYYDPYFLEYIGNKPFVMTVYDLIHEIFPEYNVSDTQLKSAAVLQKANKIIAISENTKRDLVNILGIDENKIEVTYLSNSLVYNGSFEGNEKLNNLPDFFLLFVGNRTLYKNFYFFIQLFAVIAKKYPNLHLVCTGGSFTDEEIHFLDSLGIKDKVKQYYVNDDELCYLYKKAYAFVFPSLYEGFGIPILEAYSLGCPVLTSETSSLKEVGGNAALYFDPKNAESILTSLKLILGNTALREEQIKKGFEQTKKFTWENTSKSTLDVYTCLVKSEIL